MGLNLNMPISYHPKEPAACLAISINGLLAPRTGWGDAEILALGAVLSHILYQDQYIYIFKP